MFDCVTPESVGLSAQRLAFIPKHLNRYVDDGKLPGYQMLVMRRGKAAYHCRYGLRDVETGLPVEDDTLFRIYSMTKPITSVALLKLYEQGFFQLDHPVSEFIPEFKDLQVFTSGSAESYETAPPQRPVTIRDLLTQTAGLSYGLFDGHAVDKLYARQQVLAGSLPEMIRKVAQLPLLFSPGTRWNYSVATDVLGYLIEIISGSALDAFFSEHIFEPLQMHDTFFQVPAEKVDRFAANYKYLRTAKGEDSYRLVDSPHRDRTYLDPPAMFSGGGGLVSTTEDYSRFTQMLLNRGVLGDERILGRKTVELMTSNHMPGNVDLAAMGQPVFSETPFDGIGFGLGVSVMLDPAKAQILGSPGEYAWGGMASTAFWSDPVEEMTVIFMTQLMPSSTYPLRRELRVLTYQAIVE